MKSLSFLASVKARSHFLDQSVALQRSDLSSDLLRSIPALKSRMAYCNLQKKGEMIILDQFWHNFSYIWNKFQLLYDLISLVKGQIKSEWIYEIINFLKYQPKNSYIHSDLIWPLVSLPWIVSPLFFQNMVKISTT